MFSKHWAEWVSDIILHLDAAGVLPFPPSAFFCFCCMISASLGEIRQKKEVRTELSYKTSAKLKFMYKNGMPLFSGTMSKWWKWSLCATKEMSKLSGVLANTEFKFFVWVVKFVCITIIQTVAYLCLRAAADSPSSLLFPFPCSFCFLAAFWRASSRWFPPVCHTTKQSIRACEDQWATLKACKLHPQTQEKQLYYINLQIQS